MTDASGKLRVLLADDHAIIRDGIRRVIDTLDDMEVVGEASTGAEAIEVASNVEADAIVLDLSLPDVGGVELVRRFSRAHPTLAIVILTMYPEDQLARHLFKLGISAYLSKSRSSDELIDALRRVAVEPRVKPGVSEADEPKAPHQTLSPREYEVFLLLIEGRTVSEVSYALDLSLPTVSNHIAKIRAKLDVNSVGEIIRYAHRVGIGA